MTFFGYPKLKWLQLTGEVDKSVRSSCQIFSWFNVPRLIKSVNFWQNYSKNKEIDVFSGIQRTMYTVSHQPRASNFNKPDFEGIRAGCGPPLGDGPTQSRYSWYVTPVMATPSPSVVLKGILEVETPDKAHQMNRVAYRNNSGCNDNVGGDEQEAQLSPRDSAMRRVSWNLANCHATVQKLLIRKVLNKSKLWS